MISFAPVGATLSAVNTAASPPSATISLRTHSKSSRHCSVFGSTYTEFLLEIAPICCRRRHVLTRTCDGRLGSWYARRSHLGVGNMCYVSREIECVTQQKAERTP